MDENASELQKKLGAWTRTTFPDHTPAGLVAKLLEEAVELSLSVGHSPELVMVTVADTLLRKMNEERGDYRDEVNDVGMLSYAFADSIHHDLEKGIEAKFEVLQTRKWRRRENGTYQHVEE